ncbi:hypothetical protein [Caldicellulosiruptor morganii]|uniref:PKD/Chitinase domain-containing protein n=2 Tax=Caldicellulosiruptor morganii TaxID=1387555 RepID=A0ABY7BNI5_9FIRM|nr:hypothetical protein [Caldicellulosiruptor morganii]WAM33315.1 hypothetical protein OTK00_001810 [Caldicellulosiruptor morganii]
MFKSKGRNKSLALFLIAVFMLEIVVQFVPLIRAYAIDYSAVANNYYEGGFDSYNGITRDDVIRDIFNNKANVYINNQNGTFYLNTEYAIDYRRAVYGLPGNVPGNPYGATKVSYSANPWKPSSVGYWWIKEYTPNVATLVPPNTSGATRVIFQYDGYGMDKKPYQNPYWTINGDDNLKWSDLTSSNLASRNDNDVKSQYASLVAQDKSENLTTTIKDKMYNDYIRGNRVLSIISSNKDLNGHYINDLSWLTKDMLFSKGVVIGSPGEGYLQVILFFRKNGVVAPVKFTGAINKFMIPNSNLEAYSISYGSPNLPKTSDGSAFLFDPAKNSTANINLTVKGVFHDLEGVPQSYRDIYKSFFFTRDEAQYYTVINYFKINGVDYTDQLVYRGITGENRYRKGEMRGNESNNDKVVFTSKSTDYNIQIPANLLQPGENTITVSAKVRVFFTAGYHMDAYNSASQTIKIIVQPKLSAPTLQLSVTPSQSTVSISNGQYVPSTIQHKVQPAKVSNITVPAGWKLVRLDFIIDKDVNRVQSATTPDYSESYNTTATTITSFTQSKTFNYNTTYIQPNQTGTPAYYGKVRYVVKGPSGNLHNSDWSGTASTSATVKVIPKDGSPVLAAASSDKIRLDSAGNPKTYTVKINVSAQIDEVGSKTIQRWVFVAIHKQNQNEKATQTVTTTSRSASTTLQVNIATSSSRTSEDFDVSGTLYFTDGSQKKTNTVTVSVPVESNGAGIDLTLTADKTLLSGKPGDVKSVTITANSTITATGSITDHRVWIRADYEQSPSPTASGTQQTLTAKRTFTYVLKKDMNGKDLIFVARSKATVGTNSLDSGQKTVKVRVVVTDDTNQVPDNQTVPEDQPIMPVEEPPNNPPTATLQAIPGVIAQGDDAFLVATASDTDKDDSATITAITASGGNVEGFAQSKNQASAIFWSDETGAYTATAVATDTKGATGTAQTSITVIPAIPRPVCYISGALKENRKVVLDASGSYAGSKRATINWSTARWKITPVDSNIPANSIKVVESLTGSQKLNCLFKTAGRYRVDLTITNNYGNSATGTWYLDIKPDEKPVVSFTTPTKILRDPLDSSQASIQITSNSYSPDNDTIVKHVWFYAWDSNNDGNFDNETWYVRKADGTWQAIGDYNAVKSFDIETFDSGNNSTITFKTNNVGKYKIELAVREEFGQETIDQFVTAYDRKRDNSINNIEDDMKTIEVLNVAPFATLSSSKVTKKTLNITVKTNYPRNSTQYAQIVAKLNNLKADLYSYGINLRYGIDIATRTAGKYQYTIPGGTVTKYLYQGGISYSINFSSQDSNGKTWTHKIEYLSFKDSSKYDSYQGDKVYSSFLDYARGISVSFVGVDVITEQYSPSNGDGTSYTYRVHYKENGQEFTSTISGWFSGWRTSGFNSSSSSTAPYMYYSGTTQDITLPQTVNTDIIAVNNSILTPTSGGDDNVSIFITDSTSTDYSQSFDKVYPFASLDNDYLKLLIDYNVKTYIIAPSAVFDLNVKNVANCYNTIQKYTLRQLANATDGKLYDSAGNAIAQLDQALNDIKEKYTNPQLTPDPVYILTNEEQLIYYPYWEDYENDVIIDQRWHYEHDETVFDNNLGKAEFDGTWLNAPIEVFTKPGKYYVTFQVQDNPPPRTSDFDEYKLWSKLERQMILYVHRRPVADFTAVYNKSTGKVTITDKSYDPDHQYNRSDKGIIAWKWQYKTTDDANWTDTTLTNLQNMTLQSGKVYLIKLEVQDCDGPNGVGVWSKPKIAMIDLSVANRPPVANFIVDSEILKGNQPSNLTDKSYDPDGDTITAWHWWIYNSDGRTNKDFGETTSNNITTVKNYIATMSEGSYKLSLQVKDSAGNYSAVTTKQFRIYSPSKDTTPELTNNPPTGTFTMTITDHRTRLKPSTTYSDPDSDPKNAEQWYIKFNGQTKYYNKLPNTLEEAGYTYDGTYEVGYRVQDNPTGRSPSLKPLWSNWYVQTYYISTDITIQAWTEKFAKRARNMTEVPSIVKNTIKTSDFKLGEGIIVKAKTFGYVEKIEVWFDRVDTRTPREGKTTKIIEGYWECSLKNGTMTLTDLHTILYPEETIKNREISYEAVKGKKPLPAPVFSTVPYSMSWSSDIFDPKLQPKFIISNNNSYVKEKWPDRYRDLWDGLYKWSDWPLGNRFSYAKAMEIYGRPPYLIKGDVLRIKLRAYRKNADGSYTTKEIDLPVNIVGSIEIGTGEIN